MPAPALSTSLDSQVDCLVARLAGLFEIESAPGSPPPRLVLGGRDAHVARDGLLRGAAQPLGMICPGTGHSYPAQAPAAPRQVPGP